MKQKYYTLLLLAFIGFLSCRKDKYEPNIKQYDQAQILSYISTHGISSMVRDTVGGDTTGIYYQILMPAKGPKVQLQYSDKISMVFTLRSFDGTYTSLDTINNHFEDYIGHINSDKLPLGLQTAIINDLKYSGAYSGSTMRLLIPSHLAYGISGYGSGSTQNSGTHIGGNQCLDYYVNVVNSSSDSTIIPKISNRAFKKQASYDSLVIKNYMRDSSFTGYKQTADGLWYKILTPGTGTDPITSNSSITATYTGQLLNASIFDGSNNGVNVATLPINGLIPGVIEGLTNYATAGTKISLLIPSGLGYGLGSNTGIPVNSCLRFTFQIITVSP